MDVVVEHVTAFDAETGCPILMQRWHLERLRKAGVTTIRLELPAVETERCWMTVKDATVTLMNDDADLNQVSAKSRVQRARAAGKFQSDAKGRIDPISFDHWRQTMRDRRMRQEDSELSDDRVKMKRRELHLEDDDDE
jgi:hypothetical protein